MPPPSFIQRLLGRVSGTGARRRARAANRRARKTVSLCKELLSQRGEASGAAIARDALAALGLLEGPSLAGFFDAIGQELSPDPESILKAADAYRNDPSHASLSLLQQAVESPRQELFRRLNTAPGGTAALIEMRRRAIRGSKSNPHWAPIEADLGHLLGAWFNRGFLLLRRIDWRTSALVLEKLIQHEAVHEIQGWSDLRRRLQADRRCFAFFHPALPEEPIIFIEVALTRGMSGRVQPLLDADTPVADPLEANCAIFYSITNCQEGLRGISFGNFLIKQVAEDLGREFPRIKTFATLSPIPDFRTWMEDAAKDHPELNAGIPLRGVLRTLAEPGWHETHGGDAQLQAALTRLCAWYLLHAKRNLEPRDSVARFHLSNGARLERLNWLADISKSGLARSAGMMVNYVYRLEEIERNHEAYVNQRAVVSSAKMRLLARECRTQAKAPVR